MKVPIINNSHYDLPSYSTKQSSGLDLRANIIEKITLTPFERKLIPTGLSISIPEGYEAQVRPRSGLSIKNGITVLNSPGTIDSDYRGDIGVILINLSNESYDINPGDRIAQLVFSKYEEIEWVTVLDLPVSRRGESGFGSTGKR
ncbi:MAG: dUTP diphosphatase [Flavobacteriaceae bacterium]|nr:dUTP diphosphatase [Flavobacteriaceae bacterium]